MITVSFGLIVTAALWVFMKITRLGVAMRAVVDDADLLDTGGLNPNRVRRYAWVIGSCIAAASGVLFAPLLPLNPIQLTLLVVAAFGAAAIGAMRSIPLTFLGGLLIGVLASLSTRYLTEGILSGVAPSLPFLVLFLVLLVYPKRYLSSIEPKAVEIASTWKPPTGLLVGMGVAVIMVLALVPTFAGIHLTDWTRALAATILFLSLGLLVRTSGLVSLCHVGFAAIGAVAFSHLTVDVGMPWLLALLITGLIAVPIGAILAIPAIRLPALFLALATFGFGILLQYMFYTEPYMFGAGGAGLELPRPELDLLSVDTDRGFYYVVLLFAILAVAFVVALTRSRLGRLLRGVAGSAVAIQTGGASISTARVLIFCISAFLAAVAGALEGVAQSTVSASSYPPLLSLAYLTVMLIILCGAPWNALIAGFSLILIPSYVPGADVAVVMQLLFGATAILLVFQPESARHLPPAVTSFIDRIFRRATEREIGEATKSIQAQAIDAVPRRARDGSPEVADLHVRYGGSVAVQSANLVAPTGQITGLIGPNGAGKTSTFNACSGLLRPTRGRILLHGKDVSHWGAAARARQGLGRTFQRMELCESLTVHENVALGAEALLAGANPWSHLFPRAGQHRAVRADTAAALDLCGIASLAHVSVSTLSTGQRRLVELARCVAGNHDVLLLDEPSSGLDKQETAVFAQRLTTLVEQRGIGILLVEHDLSLVLSLCARIYVLDFGEMLFEGTPDEVMTSPLVKAAYLGEHLDVELPSDASGGVAVEARSDVGVLS